MRWKTLILRCSKFIQETVCQISSQLPEFCRRYYRKHFGLFFSGHGVCCSRARSGTAWDNMPYRHFSAQLQTIPPLLFCETPYHYVLSIGRDQGQGQHACRICRISLYEYLEISEPIVESQAHRTPPDSCSWI